jgi:hypothetical protein
MDHQQMKEAIRSGLNESQGLLADALVALVDHTAELERRIEALEGHDPGDE